MKCERMLKSSLKKKEFLEILLTIKPMKKEQEASYNHGNSKNSTTWHIPPMKPRATNSRHVKQPKRLYANKVIGNVIPPQKQSRTNFHQSNLSIKEILKSLHPTRIQQKYPKE